MMPAAGGDETNASFVGMIGKDTNPDDKLTDEETKQAI